MNKNVEIDLNIPQKYIDRVWMWNEERNLLDKFDPDTEFKMLEEEYKELLDAKAAEARMRLQSEACDEDLSTEIKKQIHEQVDARLDIDVVFIGSVIKSKLHGVNLQEVLPSYKIYASLVETSFEDIRSLGYEPNCAFNECLLEIESRTGRINDQGKFQKWVEGDKEFTGNYKANYDLCKLKD